MNRLITTLALATSLLVSPLAGAQGESSDTNAQNPMDVNQMMEAMMKSMAEAGGMPQAPAGLNPMGMTDAMSNPMAMMNPMTMMNPGAMANPMAMMNPSAMANPMSNP
ncbi:MAG: hypothetical protein OXS40_03560, partial [Gammaproteobacteria bacterium]|nr:hypothetical protein [Gammaproteobacteria bacterium]